MSFARAMGCGGGIIVVDLGGPEHVRIVLGPVKSVKERAGLLACLFEQGRERGNVLFGLALPDSDTSDDGDL